MKNIFESIKTLSDHFANISEKERNEMRDFFTDPKPEDVTVEDYLKTSFKSKGRQKECLSNEQKVDETLFEYYPNNLFKDDMDTIKSMLEITNELDNENNN
jgi:hypothetical protein